MYLFSCCLILVFHNFYSPVTNCIEICTMWLVTWIILTTTLLWNSKTCLTWLAHMDMHRMHQRKVLGICPWGRSPFVSMFIICIKEGKESLQVWLILAGVLMIPWWYNSGTCIIGPTVKLPPQLPTPKLNKVHAFLIVPVAQKWVQKLTPLLDHEQHARSAGHEKKDSYCKVKNWAFRSKTKDIILFFWGVRRR